MTAQLLFETAAERRTAVFSAGFRYTLTCEWSDALPLLVWLMLNPSKADDKDDDSTIRRVRGFTRRAGRYGGFVVGNLYGMIATAPRDLIAALKLGMDAVGPDNDKHLRLLLAYANSSGSDVVCAWGGWGAHRLVLPRAREVYRLVTEEANIIPLCLGLTAAGQPLHPVRLPDSATLRPYELSR